MMGVPGMPGMPGFPPMYGAAWDQCPGFPPMTMPGMMPQMRPMNSIGMAAPPLQAETDHPTSDSWSNCGWPPAAQLDLSRQQHPMNPIGMAAPQHQAVDPASLHGTSAAAAAQAQASGIQIDADDL